MNALVLEEVRTLRLRGAPTPVAKEGEVVIRVGGVGLCGTDLHIFNGINNFHRDERGRPIPLDQHPQVLGHEFCGRVVAFGAKVSKVKLGDRVVVDQFLNCRSQARVPICEYCESGNSHQCEVGQELGVTGPWGAFVDYIAVPETNVVALPASLTFAKAVLVEPLACVVHASDRMERAQNRYTFDGRWRIGYILVAGAGPSGLLFVQYLRNVKHFDNEIFVVDMKEARLALAERLGATPLDVRKVDVVAEVRRRTRGEGIHYLIEATGSAAVFDWLPQVLRHQATVLIYGGAYFGGGLAALAAFQGLENTLVTSAGGSGGFDPDGTPTTYRLAMECIRDGRIDADSILTHRYTELGQIQRAFTEDACQEDYIKGVLLLSDPA